MRKISIIFVLMALTLLLTACSSNSDTASIPISDVQEPLAIQNENTTADDTNELTSAPPDSNGGNSGIGVHGVGLAFNQLLDIETGAIISLGDHISVVDEAFGEGQFLGNSLHQRTNRETRRYLYLDSRLEIDFDAETEIVLAISTSTRVTYPQGRFEILDFAVHMLLEDLEGIDGLDSDFPLTGRVLMPNGEVVQNNTMTQVTGLYSVHFSSLEPYVNAIHMHKLRID